MKRNILVFIAIFLTLPIFAAAEESSQGYSTLINSDLSNAGGINEFLNDFFLIAISAAVIFATIKIIIAGVKYMLSDVVTSKEDAKKDIRTSLLGLIVILAAVLILNTINPNLTNFSLRFVKPPAASSVDILGGNSTTNQNITSTFACVNITEEQQADAKIYTADATNCSDTDKTPALEAFAADCGRRNNATHTPKTATTAECSVPYVRSTTPIIEFALSSYGKWAWYDPKDEYVSRQGNVFIYDVVRQCNSETDGRTADSVEYDKCLDNIEDVLFETELTTGLIGFCTNNGAKDFVRGPNDYRCTLPTWKTKDDDFIRAYEANLTGTQQSNWNLEAFTTMCEDEGGTIVDIETFRYTGIDDYRCVKY